MNKQIRIEITGQFDASEPGSGLTTNFTLPAGVFLIGEVTQQGQYRLRTENFPVIPGFPARSLVLVSFGGCCISDGLSIVNTPNFFTNDILNFQFELQLQDLNGLDSLLIESIDSNISIAPDSITGKVQLSTPSNPVCISKDIDLESSAFMELSPDSTDPSILDSTYGKWVVLQAAAAVNADAVKNVYPFSLSYQILQTGPAYSQYTAPFERFLNESGRTTAQKQYVTDLNSYLLDHSQTLQMN